MRRPASSEDSTSTAEHSARRLPRVPGYRVVKLLGRGAMGEVFLAEEKRLERRVALKLLTEEAVSQGEARARFEREAKAMATVEHRHVVRVYAFGEIPGEHHPRPFLAMEYVEGKTLADRLEREGRLPLADALLIVRQTVEALQAAWHKRIVHRDVKPGNILLDSEGSVRVGDFGIAKAMAIEDESATATAIGTSLGTPLYVSPEQALARTLDFRADVYSLGVVLWEMVAGRRPFEETNPHLLISHHINDPLPRLAEAGVSVPAAVEELVARITDKDSFARCESHQQLLSLIDRVSASPGPPADASAAPETRPEGLGIDAALHSLSPQGQRPKVFEEMMHLGRGDPAPAGLSEASAEDLGPEDATALRGPAVESTSPVEEQEEVPGAEPSGGLRGTAAAAATAGGPSPSASDETSGEQAADAREEAEHSQSSGRAPAGRAGDLDLGDLDLESGDGRVRPGAKGREEEHLPPLELDRAGGGRGRRRPDHRADSAGKIVAPSADDPPLEAAGDESLDRLLGVLEHRRSLSRLQRQREEMGRVEVRRRFERLKDEVVKPALRKLMVRLHAQGHPTRLQDLGREGLRFEFVLDSTPMVRCHLEVELNDRGLVVLRFLENLGVVAEEQLAPHEVTGKLLGERIVAFLGKGR